MDRELKILLATDFSPNSKIALRTIIRLKKKYQIDVFFIHVIESFWKNWVASGLYTKEAIQRLDTWQQELTKDFSPEKLYVKVGNPADLIISEGSKIKPDLIVVGSRKTHAKGRYKLGTTVENVTRSAKQSVLVCKTKKLSNILCGVDCSKASAKALNWAIDLAKQFKVPLSIVFVLPKVSVSALGIDEEDVVKEEETVMQENSARFEQFLQAFDFANIEVKKFIRWGMPPHVILDMAEDFEYDLIVIGAQGHSILHHVLMGSTADKILRFAPCSLLVAR